MRTLLIVLSGWLAVAAAFTLQQLATTVGPVDGERLRAIVLPTLTFDLLWAALTFGIIALVDRIPLRDGRLPRFLALHAALSIVAALVQLFAYTSILAVVRGTATSFPRLVVANLSTGLFIYWLVLGAVMAVRQRARSRERQRIQDALESNLAATRAAMLRAQLQPHFLFNTLNTIAALIPEEPLTAERMVARLGDLLRVSLDETRGATVSLSQDLAALDAYLAIETLRLGDRLRVVRDIAPETLAARIPDLLLQPLAENAIRHGIGPKLVGGRLTISTRREAQTLYVEVSDDGVGAIAADIGAGIGLRNTRERVALISGGPDDALTIRTAPGSGFSVTVALPWQSA